MCKPDCYRECVCDYECSSLSTMPHSMNIFIWHVAIPRYWLFDQWWLAYCWGCCLRRCHIICCHNLNQQSVLKRDKISEKRATALGFWNFGFLSPESSKEEDLRMLRFLVRLAGTETPAPSPPLGHDLYNPAIASENTVRHPVLHDNDGGYFWCLCLMGPRHLRKRPED